VPDSGAPRPLWLADPGIDEAEIAEFEKLGREWLASGAQTDEVHQDGRIVVVGIGSGHVAGASAVVAATRSGTIWSETERDLVTFAAQIFASVLDGRTPESPALRAPVGVRLDQPWPSKPDLETGMRYAIANGELSLVFQPELDLITSEVTAVEALVRWHHPTLGELGPDSFITLAERSDLIKIVGAWVVDESVRALADWLAQVPELDIRLRVNVSPAQLAGDELILLFRAALKAHGVAGERLCVEITENYPVADPDEVARTLRELKELGITSALDDLASGYSTLSHLRRLPVDVVKIDRSLVSGLHEDQRAQAIVTALIGLALVLDIDVVAEGVENVREAQALVRLGCSRAQGHYLGRPSHAPDIVELLRESGRRVRVSH
jgi:EAL domain-containing protein (putative c-di-GMP-specific phosphodiesterase class I)